MMRALWYPGAVRRAGPPEKDNGPRSETRAAVGHSMEGTLAGALSVLDNTTRRSDGKLVRPGSWTLSFPKQGQPLQHYPMDRGTNHARGGNGWSFGWETEGVAGEPLTPHQEREIAAFLRWDLDEGWLPDLRRGDPGKTIHRHYEIVGSSTACDSDRHDYDRIFPLVRTVPSPQEDDDMAWKGEMFRIANEPHVWWTNYETRRWIQTPAEAEAYKAAGIPITIIPVIFRGLLLNIPVTPGSRTPPS